MCTYFLIILLGGSEVRLVLDSLRYALAQSLSTLAGIGVTCKCVVTCARSNSSTETENNSPVRSTRLRGRFRRIFAERATSVRDTHRCAGDRYATNWLAKNVERHWKTKETLAVEVKEVIRNAGQPIASSPFSLLPIYLISGGYRMQVPIPKLPTASGRQSLRGVVSFRPHRSPADRAHSSDYVKVGEREGTARDSQRHDYALLLYARLN